MATSLALALHLYPPPFPSISIGFQAPLSVNLVQLKLRRNPRSPLKSPISASLSSSNPSSSWEREEIRWLREEQRWLREEQRWIREESRWNSERESLLREIASLKLHIESLELEKPSQGSSISDAIVKLAAQLQALKEVDSKSTKNLIAESGSGSKPMVLEESEVKEVVFEEYGVSKGSVEEKHKKKASLRKGSEGDAVRDMQEALQKLGFYSGEEDMEYSSFSSGTERAVKTWQSSISTPEDGIMTAELLERLFMELGMVDADLKVNADKKEDFIAAAEKDGENGAVVASVAEVTEIQQNVLKESGVTEVNVSERRVFLLGENRWEEPSRLLGRRKITDGSKVGEAIKCLTCRGEGRLMCTECDGTGEPNIEPQFMEWVDEGAKCPYCEGLGYTVCDVCDGNATFNK